VIIVNQLQDSNIHDKLQISTFLYFIIHLDNRQKHTEDRFYLNLIG